MKLFSAFLLFLLFFQDVGGAADQNDINLKLQQGGLIHLPAGTYVLSDSIVLQSNTILEGEPGTIITIPDHAGWPAWKPLISGTDVYNVTIKNLEINANSDGNIETPHGAGYYNCIYITGCKNISVNNCTLLNGLGDGLRTRSSTDIKFFNNLVSRLGHEGFFGIESQNLECFNNHITTRTDCALRVWNCAHVRFHDNIIDAQLNSLGGNSGIQIEDSNGSVNCVEIWNNVLIRTWGAGIKLISYDAGISNNQWVQIHQNLFYEVGQSYNIPYTGGIVNDGFKGTWVYNNVFDNVKNNAFRNQAGGQGTIIKDNIITNTVQHTFISQTGTGYGIADLKGAGLTITGNCFYSNENGNLYQATSLNDDLSDPKTHKTSSGWTWTNSTWTCESVKPVEFDSLPLVVSIEMKVFSILHKVKLAIDPDRAESKTNELLRKESESLIRAD